MAIDKKLIDQLLSDYKKPEDIIGENGLLKEVTKAILERDEEKIRRWKQKRWPEEGVNRTV